MSNATDGIGPAIIEAFIQETFETFVLNSVTASSIALLLYTILLSLSQEADYIWFKAFSPPALLYLLTRYTLLIGQLLLFALELLPMSATILSCDIISYAANSTQVLQYIGAQGLLAARAYSLCQGNKFIVAALGFGLLAGIVLNLLTLILFGGCFISQDGMLSACILIQSLELTSPFNGSPVDVSLLNLLTDIDIVLIDLLAFGVCFYNVWDTWRLQRTVHLGNGGLASVLLRQVISRVSFTVILTLAIAVLHMSIPDFAIGGSLDTVQKSLSSILLSEFTLELRQRNSAAITANIISLPPIRSVPDMLQHIHQSVLVEMGDWGAANAENSDVIQTVLPPDSDGVEQSPDSPQPESANISV